MKKKLSLKVEPLEERIAPNFTFIEGMPESVPSDFGPVTTQVGDFQGMGPWTGTNGVVLEVGTEG